jgi:hypothetical protein
VRCGACQEVFDGNATLVNLDAPAPEPEPMLEAAATENEVPLPLSNPIEAGTPDLVAEPEVASPEPEPEPAANAAHGIEEFYTLDFDTAFDPLAAKEAAPEPQPEPAAEPEPAAQPEPEPEPEPEPAAETWVTPEPGLTPEPLVETEIRLRPAPLPDTGTEPSHDDAALPVPDEEIVATALPEEAPDPALLLTRESAPGEPVAAEPLDITPMPAPRKGGRKARPRPAPRPFTAPEPAEPVEPEHDEPEFVRRSRLQEKSGRTRRTAMAAASALLVLALLLQAATTFRNVLAAQFPQLKPLLAATCRIAGCRIELPAQIETLSVETGQLEAISGTTFLFSTILHNQGGLVQAWPNLELALTDADNKTVLRRVLAPAQYLPKDVVPARGFAAGAEQPIRIYFELDQIKASGYRIAVFYP